MRIAIYGAKSIPDGPAAAAVEPELDLLQPSEIWYGGGTTRGTDLAAFTWAARHTTPVSSTALDWQRYGAERAAIIRSDAAARWAQVVLVLWDPHAPEPDGTLAALVRAGLGLGRRVILRSLGAPEVRFDTASVHSTAVLPRVSEHVTGASGKLLEVLVAPRVPRPRRRRAA